MHEIIFYKDKNGNSPVLDYIQKLQKNSSKDSRIKVHMNTLKSSGTQIGEPYVKHIDGDIWELRPISDRILFAEFVTRKRHNSKKLEELSGVKQPIIARMEKGSTSPNLTTVLKVLAPLGKTLYIGDIK